MEQYSRTVRQVDGSTILESVVLHNGQDPSVLPQWAQEQRQRRFTLHFLRHDQQEMRQQQGEDRRRQLEENRQQRLLQQATRMQAQQERQHRAAERVSRMQELQGQQMGSGNFVFTDRWVDGDGVSHTSTFLRTN